MKKNIRYVAIYLSVGRVVPHDAATVLQNKFGDCKDKATLMSALLATKGIASEHALINFGNAYTLPEPPTMLALNHVILYLPEFGVYDDPTANFAAFGVLAAENYDKPVVRVSGSGVTVPAPPQCRRKITWLAPARPLRSPPMGP
jgi:transglutaminase-like putative cysteine protease